MLFNIKDSVQKYSNSFSKWALAILNQTEGITEIAIVGKGAKAKGIALQSAHLIPYIIMTSEKQTNQYPLLSNKPISESLPIYICKEYACHEPLNTVDEVLPFLA
jgi:uncharacterized protein YyaL (SSP411 family)